GRTASLLWLTPERLRIEQEIRKMQRAVEQSPATVVITDPNGTIEYVNSRFLQTTGYGAGEVIGQNPRILKSGDKGPEEYAELWATILAGQEWRGEFLNRRKDGSLYWEAAIISPIRDERGVVTNFMGIKEDITDRKKMEADLIHARAKAELDAAEEKILEGLLRLSLARVPMQEFLNRVIDTLVDEVPWLKVLPKGGIFLTSDKGNGKQLNLIASHELDAEILNSCAAVEFGSCLCGRVAESRKLLHDGHVGSDHDIAFDGMEPHGHYVVPIVHGDAVLGVLVLYLPDGHARNPDEEQFLRRAADVLSIGISRRYAAAELERAKEIAEAANQAKSSFLSSMSHELRTPLNAILGFAQVMQFNPGEPLTEKQKGSIEQIMKGGEHLLNLINEVLDLSKIETGEFKPDFEDFLPAKSIDQCLVMTQAMAQKYGVAVRMDGDAADLPYIRADRMRFEQVLLNLLSNAVKYNHAGGSVILSFRRRDEDRLRIAITDTGPGIARDVQDQVFMPFRRLGRESGAIEGTGIGLYITKDLVELMNGRIGFDSTPGEGTTFWVEFPVVGKASDPVARAAAALDDSPFKPVAAPSERVHTVLYVEANPANAEVMKHLFAMMDGVELRLAQDAELGIAMAQGDPPDLILMDINLPGMNGIEATRVLKESGNTAGIPVFAVSAEAMQNTIDKAMAMGFADYITKPINLAEVADKVRKALGLA
ncbi:MAG: PAS domain S-box protein, partial [Alphaproteobacteria bacterium]|nr:PAS domain S-box protein [Alphaproteobacteria bacterium]